MRWGWASEGANGAAYCCCCRAEAAGGSGCSPTAPPPAAAGRRMPQPTVPLARTRRRLRDGRRRTRGGGTTNAAATITVLRYPTTKRGRIRPSSDPIRLSSSFRRPIPATTPTPTAANPIPIIPTLRRPSDRPAGSSNYWSRRANICAGPSSRSTGRWSGTYCGRSWPQRSAVTTTTSY